MKKKILPIIAMCLLILGLAGCGTDPTTVDYNGYSYDDLQTTCQSTVKTLEFMSTSDMEDYIQNGSEITQNLVQSWMENRTDLGDFIGFGEFKVDKAGKTLSATQTVEYQERPLTLTYVFNYNSMEVTSVDVDLVYTTGEKMEKAALNTVMCMAVVFAVLIIISLIIYAFNLIPKIQQRFSKEGDAPAEKKEITKKPAAAQQVTKQETNTNNTELIAVIAAAIAAATGTTTDDFVVRSIKRR